MSVKYTQVTKHTVQDLLKIRTIQHLNQGGQESEIQFAIYDSDTSLILKQGQGHQTWYELLDPTQGYNNAASVNSVHEKANDKKFLSNLETRQLSPQNMFHSIKQ